MGNQKNFAVLVLKVPLGQTEEIGKGELIAVSVESGYNEKDEVSGVTLEKRKQGIPY